MLYFLLSYLWETDYGGAAEYMSGYYLEDSVDYKGGEVTFPDGFSQLTEKLAEGLDIDLNQQVTSIDYTQNVIMVQTSSGSYMAKKVIVTVPLAILQQNVIEFIPALPAQKTEAINRLGCGLLDKLILCFDRVFWDKEIDWFNYCSDGRILSTDGESESGDGVSPSGYWSSAFNVFKSSGDPVLMFFNAANQARDYSQLTDDEVIQSAFEVINHMYPDEQITRENNLVAYRRSNWSQDQYAGMAYTYPAVGSKPKDFKEISKPVGVGKKERVWFAGEHTYYDFIGCTHAAYLSGLEAADQVISNLKN